MTRRSLSKRAARQTARILAVEQALLRFISVRQAGDSVSMDQIAVVAVNALDAFESAVRNPDGGDFDMTRPRLLVNPRLQPPPETLHQVPKTESRSMGEVGVFDFPSIRERLSKL